MERNFELTLKKRGFILKRMREDGACLFRAVGRWEGQVCSLHTYITLYICVYMYMCVHHTVRLQQECVVSPEYAHKEKTVFQVPLNSSYGLMGYDAMYESPIQLFNNLWVHMHSWVVLHTLSTSMCLISCPCS